MNNVLFNEKDFIDLNVVILPNTDLSLKMIQWSRLISTRHKTNYILDQKKYFPHLSLYSARYPFKNKQAVENAVKQIAMETGKFEIKLEGFSCFSGYFFYDAKKNKELVALHERIVDTLNSLREGLISDNQRQLKGLSHDHERAIQEYGYLSVKKLYMPHISLTHLVYPLKFDQAKGILPKEINLFTTDTIAISHFAEYGTFPRPIVKYNVEDLSH